MEPSRRIDEASEEDARVWLRQCCGSDAWVSAMLARRPFGSTAELLEAAHDVWWSLSPGDWKEAFASHPKIGQLPKTDVAAGRKSRATELAAREQAGVRNASEDILSALANANDRYLQRFGYIFIVCATGKTATDMLEILQARLANPPDREIRIAAGEQEKITAIRLEAPQAPGTFSARGGTTPNP